MAIKPNIKQEKLGSFEYFSIHPALRKSVLTFHKLPLQSQGIYIQITINKLLTKNDISHLNKANIHI